MPTRNILLGSLLIKHEFISEADLLFALKVQHKNGGALDTILLDLNMVSQQDLDLTLAELKQADIEHLSIDDIVVEPAKKKVASHHVPMFGLSLTLVLLLSLGLSYGIYRLKASEPLPPNFVVPSVNIIGAGDSAPDLDNNVQTPTPSNVAGEEMPPGADKALPKTLTADEKTIDFTEAARISGIESTGSFRDMRIVFESDKPLADAFHREYLGENRFAFRFRNSFLAVKDAEVVDKHYWLKESFFERDDSSLTWYFTLRQPGTAIYQELVPESPGAPYRFLVILRDL